MLLFVSHPLVSPIASPLLSFLWTLVVLLILSVGDVSLSLAAKPIPTKSIILPLLSTNLTLHSLPDIEILPVASGVSNSSLSPAPAPCCIR